MKFATERIAPMLAQSGLFLLLLLPPFGGSSDLRSLAAMLALFGGLTDVLVAGRAGRTPAWLMGPWPIVMAGFLLGAFLVTPLHHDGAERILLWSAVLVGGGVVAQEVGRRGSSSVLRALLVITVAIALRALAERLYLFDQLRTAATALLDGGIDENLAPFFASLRARVSFGQANGLAAFVTLLLPFAVGRALESRSDRLPGSLLSVLLLATLWASGSRGGALAALTALSASLAFGPVGRPRVIGRALLMASGLGWLLVLAVMLFGAQLVEPEGAFTTLLLRRDYAIHALEVSLARFPVGCGLELFGMAQDAAATSYSRYAHQFVLGLSAETGMVGLFALAGLAALVVSLCRAGGKEGVGNETPAEPGAPPIAVFAVLSLTTILGLMGFLVTGQLANLALVLGLALAGDRFIARPLAREPRWGDRRALAAGALGLLLHAQIDFDLRIASLTAAFALICALALAGTADSGPQRPLRTLTFGFLVLLGLGAYLLAPPLDLRDLRSADPVVRDRARTRLEAAPDALRELPGLRRLRREPPGGR